VKGRLAVTTRSVILFTVFCMALQHDHCYVVSADDVPFDTFKECREAIPGFQARYSALYYHGSEIHRAAKPEASWCEDKNW